MMERGICMINIIKKSNEYVKTMDCWDIGVLKICAMSFGMLAGLSVSKENKSKTAVAAGALCALSCATMMSDYLKFMVNDAKEASPSHDLREEFFDDDNFGLL